MIDKTFESSNDQDWIIRMIDRMKRDGFIEEKNNRLKSHRVKLSTSAIFISSFLKSSFLLITAKRNNIFIIFFSKRTNTKIIF